MPFLISRSVFINLRVMIRRKEKKADINILVFSRTVRDMWNCECQRCSE